MARERAPCARAARGGLRVAATFGRVAHRPAARESASNAPFTTPVDLTLTENAGGERPNGSRRKDSRRERSRADEPRLA
jgi:hypothetical protein